MAGPGTLYIVATPIGNLEDITLRALRVLKEVDLIAAEDTRRTRKLLTHYDIHRPLVSYHEHNRRPREELLLRELLRGKNVALVTDAGTPGISDPGEHLVQMALREAIPLVSIPGPSAFVAALSISGLPAHHLLFYGFLPAKPTARKKFLESLKDRPETLLFYESPRRIQTLLEDARSILGERRAVVAREMTKLYEDIYRGTISQVLAALGPRDIKGEVTVAIEGCSHPEAGEKPSIRDALLRDVRDLGLPRKEAIAQVAAELGVSRREVYQESLKLKEECKKDPCGSLTPPLSGDEAGKAPESGEAK